MLHGLQYFTAGFKQIIFVGTNFLFKDHYKLDPSTAQKYFAIINLPYAIKIVYGLIVDNVVICGSRKKAFIIIGSLMHFISL